MEKFKPTNIKGAIDTLPSVQALRNRVTDTLRRNFESYGFAPIETASLNYLELLAHKYDGNAEIVREIYKLRDQGDRDLGLRYDLTVPLCKFITMNRNLKLPFRRYEIGKVWRNGPIKAGRLREFYQCDIDIVGSKEHSVEAELMSLVVTSFRDLGIDVVIKYGNRKLLSELISTVGVRPDKIDAVIGIIDKLEKLTRPEILAELEKFMNLSKAQQLLQSFHDVGAAMSPAKNFENSEGLNEIREFERHLTAFGIKDSCVFTPHLARGLNYYTGNIWEVYDRAGRISSSLGGGGRYDNVITDWVDNGQQYPALGFSFGLEPIMAVLSMDEKNAAIDSFVDVLVIPKVASLTIPKLANDMRKAGLRVLLWHGDKVTKAMEYADKARVPYTCVMGEREIESGTVKLKNMESGKEESFKLSQADKIAKTIRGTV